MKIAIDDKCLEQFKHLKFQKSLRFIIYRVEKQTIVIETVGAREQTWQNFLDALPQKQYRYCAYDFEYKSNDGMNVSKLFFCNWAPDAAPIKLRMLYATAKENFRTYLDLLGKEVTLCSKDDKNEEELKKEFDK